MQPVVSLPYTNLKPGVYPAISWSIITVIAPSLVFWFPSKLFWRDKRGTFPATYDPEKVTENTYPSFVAVLIFDRVTTTPSEPVSEADEAMLGRAFKRDWSELVLVCPALSWVQSMLPVVSLDVLGHKGQPANDKVKCWPPPNVPIPCVVSISTTSSCSAPPGIGSQSVTDAEVGTDKLVGADGSLNTIV